MIMILVFIIDVCLLEQIIESLEWKEQEFLISMFMNKINLSFDIFVLFY